MTRLPPRLWNGSPRHIAKDGLLASPLRGFRLEQSVVLSQLRTLVRAVRHDARPHAREARGAQRPKKAPKLEGGGLTGAGQEEKG